MDGIGKGMDSQGYREILNQDMGPSSIKTLFSKKVNC